MSLVQITSPQKNINICFSSALMYCEFAILILARANPQLSFRSMMDRFEICLRITETIILRPLKLSDAEDSFKLVDKNRANLRRWLPWVDFINNVDDEINYIKESAKAILNGKKFEMGVFIQLKQENHQIEYKWNLIGMCGFPEITNNIGFIGYWLDEDYRGKGIVTMSCRSIMSKLPILLDLKELRILASPENSSSVNVAEKLGFIKSSQLTTSSLFGESVKVVEFRYFVDS